MLVGASSVPLEEVHGGGWRLNGWASPRVIAGVTSRQVDAGQLLQELAPSALSVEAEQIHGSGIAVISGVRAWAAAVPGCDALLTATPGLALRIRTADCLPLFFAAPGRGLIGIAHAGWRGLASSLPARVVAAFRHVFHARAEELSVAIGPAIRACCYEVGPEFRGRFGPFVQERPGRRTCDLIAAAVEQLCACGVRAERIFDAQRCTACEPQRWFSLRREGQQTGRLTSFILLKS